MGSPNVSGTYTTSWAPPRASTEAFGSLLLVIRVLVVLVVLVSLVLVGFGVEKGSHCDEVFGFEIVRVGADCGSKVFCFFDANAKRDGGLLRVEWVLQGGVRSRPRNECQRQSRFFLRHPAEPPRKDVANGRNLRKRGLSINLSVPLGTLRHKPSDLRFIRWCPCESFGTATLVQFVA